MGSGEAGCSLISFSIRKSVQLIGEYFAWWHNGSIQTHLLLQATFPHSCDGPAAGPSLATLQAQAPAKGLSTPQTNFYLGCFWDQHSLSGLTPGRGPAILLPQHLSLE